ncbi:MAG TPA: ATP-binding protein, partial [Thermoanaerobaculia bacterium]|nr:ATP-binding protein [Thermoanaerobaculia bacterium]
MTELAFEARYRALFETTLDGIMIVDESGTYVDLNDAMCGFLRGTREQLLGRRFAEFIPPDRLDDAMRAFSELKESGVMSMEFPLRALDGTTIALEWRSRANFIPGLHLCVAREITDRQAAERALRDREERYRAFVINSTEAIWRFELDEPVRVSLPPDEQIERFYRDGFLAECNEAMARMYGFDSPADITGARLGDLLVRDDPANVEYLRAFIASGHRLTDAASVEVDRNGKTKHFINNLIGVVEDGVLVRAWGTQRDITESRHTSEERTQLVERLAFLADVTAVLGSSLDLDKTLVTIADAAVPRFADWCFIDLFDDNGRLQRIVTRHTDEQKVALALEARRLFPPPDSLIVGVPAVARTGQIHFVEHVDDTVRATIAQNEQHEAMLRELGVHTFVVVPLTAHGRTLGTIGFAHSDLARHFSTADVQLAEDLGRRAGLAIDNARLYGELERANRAKDEFLAMLSHELRTPMTATLGWAAMLQIGGVSEEMLMMAVESIAQSTRTQARLIDDLLDVSRIVTGKMRLAPQPVRVALPLIAAIETLRPAADAKQIELINAVVDRDVRVHGDAGRLQQIFTNLVSNAVKFTPRGGRVTVALSRDDANVRVSVRDTGEGIAPELLPFIFERFRQGDSGSTRRHGGLGLGLSIARNLVELHGGSLTASSDGVGRGAELVITLPLLDDARAAQISAADAVATARPLDGMQLLVVEDDPSTRAMLQNALRQFGADVTSAGAANEALEYLNARRFDVIVSDIGLPGENGYALIERIRAGESLAPNAPAIALTAYASNSEREKALSSGFHAWLAKPIDLA